jgi:hypothetical protein
LPASASAEVGTIVLACSWVRSLGPSACLLLIVVARSMRCGVERANCAFGPAVLEAKCDAVLGAMRALVMAAMCSKVP